MVSTAIWLSFDLGVRGDYESLYQWLDRYGARECGDSFVFIENYEYESDLLGELKKDIESTVGITKKSRFYVVYRNEQGKIGGKFVLGHRKASPWQGYAEGSGVDVVDAGTD